MIVTITLQLLKIAGMSSWGSMTFMRELIKEVAKMCHHEAISSEQWAFFLKKIFRAKTADQC